MSHDDHHQDAPPDWRWGYRVALIGFFAVIGYFLWTEHRAHLASAIPFLPYLLMIGCVLLHRLMHGGHSHRHEHRPHDTKRGESG